MKNFKYFLLLFVLVFSGLSFTAPKSTDKNPIKTYDIGVKDKKVYAKLEILSNNYWSTDGKLTISGNGVISKDKWNKFKKNVLRKIGKIPVVFKSEVKLPKDSSYFLSYCTFEEKCDNAWNDSNLFSKITFESGDSFSSIENMNYMFLGMYSVDIESETEFNTSNVKYMKGTFLRSKYIYLESEEWDTSNVVDMSEMFKYARDINIDLENFDTSKVEDMSGMFESSYEFKLEDIEIWDVSNVKNMNSMFRNKSYSDLDLSGWDTSKVEDMSKMFWEGSINFESIGNWNVSKVKNMSEMFYGANGYDKVLNLSEWDTSNVKTMEKMFAASRIIIEGLENLNVSKVENMEYLFANASYQQNISVQIGSWNVLNVKNMRGLFYRYSSSDFKPLYIENLTISPDTDCKGMFYARTPDDVELYNVNISDAQLKKAYKKIDPYK